MEFWHWNKKEKVLIVISFLEEEIIVYSQLLTVLS